MQNTEQLATALAGRQKTFLTVGAAGLVVSAIGWFAAGDAFYQAYLYSFIFWAGLSLGCLSALLLHHLTAGGWGFSIQRIVEAGARNLPVMALLFIPILVGLKTLFPWSNPEYMAAHDIAANKSGYLNVPFFVARQVIIFAVWIGLLYRFTSWSKALDESKDPALAVKLGRHATWGLMLYVVTVTVAAVDWGMSLEPTWFSSMYGVQFIVAFGLATLAFSIIVLTYLWEYDPFDGRVTKKHFHHLANLMLAFVVLWAYVNFSPYLLIWSGNLMEEISYYLNRRGGGLTLLSIVLMAFHFGVPLFILMWRRAKLNLKSLRLIAGWLLFMRVLDWLFLIMPAFHPNTLAMNAKVWIMLVATFVGIGGLWLGLFLKSLRAQPMLALGDPRLDTAFFHAHGPAEDLEPTPAES